MKNLFNKLSLSFGKFNTQKIRMILFFLTLVMFVLIAGAPATMGGIGG